MPLLEVRDKDKDRKGEKEKKWKSNQGLYSQFSQGWISTFMLRFRRNLGELQEKAVAERESKESDPLHFVAICNIRLKSVVKVKNGLMKHS